MVNLIIIIGILVILVAVLGFATFNVVKKNEILEDVYNSQQEWINTLKKEIQAINIHIARIDEEGLFEGDDEIGWFFEEILKISERLSLYEDKIPANDTKKEKKTEK